WVLLVFHRGFLRRRLCTWRGCSNKMINQEVGRVLLLFGNSLCLGPRFGTLLQTSGGDISAFETLLTPNSIICHLRSPPPQKELLYSAVLADVLDGLGHRTSTLPPEIRPLESAWKLFGRAATLSAGSVAVEPERPYAVELECIDALKPGDVLVATTNADRGSALWGELLSTACRAHGSAGAGIDGLPRGLAQIRAVDVPSL